ncbi:hypothetical protein CFP71_19890 [Amycolatopsis thailandensis]|uniref:PPM-type phosphatase domain-containing protein n=1 Tax=Amycolatopsis thailandensis TaxID=589330 RepID=A0A229S5T7_9PSEU|nr:protein phosphatase 2C domain-containing protein [Amycolatopsis thailandensis]OXM54069.1 hypothetical protein CFP71_19890 [Amycolatopsis thailandensis]
MRTVTAQTPRSSESQDRVAANENMALVLDGASAFEPVDVSTGLYVDHLAAAIKAHLEQEQDVDLRTVVAGAIRDTASRLGLHPGNSPSSTVSLLRARERHIDLLCLGDSAIYYGADSDEVSMLTDTRLSKLGIPEHQAYRERVAAGYGYDSRHRELLAALQREQRKRRNRPGGYWIAEADPDAAFEAIVRTVPRKETSWAVLATDGAYSPMLHLGLANWAQLAHGSEAELGNLLDICAAWEKRDDPNGRALPRAKVSDDKALAAVVL